MKTRMKLNLVFGLVVSVLAMAPPPSALAEGSGSHGGDPLVARRAWVESFIRGELKTDLMSYIRQIDPSQLTLNEGRGDVAGMIVSGFIEADITRSEYRFEDHCIDENGVERAATAKMKDLYGSICFNIERLAQEHGTREEIVGLALHEHSHHFGLEDSADQIITGVVKTYAEAINHPVGKIPAQVDLPENVKRMTIENKWLCTAPAQGQGKSRGFEMIGVTISEATIEWTHFGFGRLSSETKTGSDAHAWLDTTEQRCDYRPAQVIGESQKAALPTFQRKGSKSLEIYRLETDRRVLIINHSDLSQSWIGDKGPSVPLSCEPVDSPYQLSRAKFFASLKFIMNECPLKK